MTELHTRQDGARLERYLSSQASTIGEEYSVPTYLPPSLPIAIGKLSGSKVQPPHLSDPLAFLLNLYPNITRWQEF